MVDTGLMRKNSLKYIFLFKKYKLNIKLVNTSAIFKKT